jgi:hypothetical protein
MKKQINSIFTKHFNDLMEITNSEDLKNRVLEIVNGSSIKPLDKRKIVLDITPLGTTKSLQVYLTNSMLKYSGLGVR